MFADCTLTDKSFALYDIKTIGNEVLAQVGIAAEITEDDITTPVPVPNSLLKNSPGAEEQIG